MSNALPLSNKAIAFMSLASLISLGPGAVTILYSSSYLLEIFSIRLLFILFVVPVILRLIEKTKIKN